MFQKQRQNIPKTKETNHLHIPATLFVSLPALHRPPPAPPSPPSRWGLPASRPAPAPCPAPCRRNERRGRSTGSSRSWGGKKMRCKSWSLFGSGAKIRENDDAFRKSWPFLGELQNDWEESGFWRVCWWKLWLQRLKKQRKNPVDPFYIGRFTHITNPPGRFRIGNEAMTT